MNSPNLLDFSPIFFEMVDTNFWRWVRFSDRLRFSFPLMSPVPEALVAEVGLFLEPEETDLLLPLVDTLTLAGFLELVELLKVPPGADRGLESFVVVAMGR